MQRIIIDLHITKEEFLSWYEGSADTVFAYSRDGRSVKFPAKILQPYVTSEGVFGAFEIRFGKDNKFQSIHKLGKKA